MLVARQGGGVSAQGGSESATGLLAGGGAGSERAGGAVCAVGASALLRECGSPRAGAALRGSTSASSGLGGLIPP